MGLETKELKLRVEAKRKALEARIAKLKADAAGEANESIEKLEADLSKLKSQVKQGYENLSESAAAKLNAWLADD